MTACNQCRLNELTIPFQLDCLKTAEANHASNLSSFIETEWLRADLSAPSRIVKPHRIS
jgi:hypothetical protein